MLRLPFELRENIYKELLGDRLIHIEYTYWQHAEYDPDRTATWPDPPFCDECYLTCVGCLQEETKDLQAVPIWDKCPSLCTAHLQPLSPLPYTSADVEVTPEPWPESRSTVRKPNGRALDVTVLRSCRQIYNECHHVLYSNNTFSFNNPHVFLCFMKTIHRTNLRQIKYLQLYVNTIVEEDWYKADKFVSLM